MEKHNIKDIKDLISADKNSITFFHSKKYQEQAKKTNALFCITTDNLKNYLPTNCKPLIVENVLISTSLVTEKFYPNSNENLRYPHIGIVIINENCEIGCGATIDSCLLYTSPSPRDGLLSRMPSSA